MNEEYIYIMLPIYDNHLKPKDIQLRYTLLPSEEHRINDSLYYYLNEMKHMIEYRREWGKYKTFTNPYEFIHTPYDNIHFLTTFSPVSRSFFKLIEIQKMIELIDMKKQSIQTLHLAEGPGGFIEAMKYLRNNNEKDKYTGITLQSRDTSVPKWTKLKEKYINDVSILYDNLKDDTGNLYHVDNFIDFVERYKRRMYIITADGGFDFSVNYKNQEHSVLRLLVTQTVYAIMAQMKGGTYIMKVFDISSQATIDILFLLNTFYEEIYICKPFTSRFANSERYVICKQFRYRNVDIFYDTFVTLLREMDNNKDFSIHRILNIPIQDIFIKRLEVINSIIGQNQIENINSTLMLMDNSERNDIIEYNKKINLGKCIRWCNHHDIEYTPIQKINIFSKQVCKDPEFMKQDEE